MPVPSLGILLAIFVGLFKNKTTTKKPTSSGCHLESEILASEEEAACSIQKHLVHTPSSIVGCGGSYQSVTLEIAMGELSRGKEILGFWGFGFFKYYLLV